MRATDRFVGYSAGYVFTRTGVLVLMTTTTLPALPALGAMPIPASVLSLAGQNLNLLNQDEADFYNEARDKYMAQNVFTQASDLRAVDRLVLFETMMSRAQFYLASGCDYTGHNLVLAEQEACRKTIKETQLLVSSIQNELGLTKDARDRDQADSVGSYITKLQLAAKAHGVMRERQAGHAIEMLKEIFSMAGSYLRANNAERMKIGYDSPEDVIRIIWEVHKPNFDEIDKEYRATTQRFFIRDL